MITYKIYCLKNPKTLEIFYIGVTTQNLSERLYKHIWEAKNRKNKILKRQIILSILKDNKKPLICLIETCKESNWKQKEKLWLKRLDNISNSRNGGSGLILNRKKESIKNSSEAHYKEIVGFNRNKNPIYFKSVKEAKEFLKVKHLTNITECLNKRSKTVKNYHFVYEKDFNLSYMNNFQFPNRQPNSLVYYNGKTYTNKELSNKIGCSETFINLIKEGKRDYKKSKFFKDTDVIYKIMI